MILLEQAENCRAVLVCLRQHGLSGLEKNVVLRVFRHFLCHVRIADRGLGCRHILGCRHQVGGGVVQPALYSADGGLLIESFLESIVQNIDGRIGVLLGTDVEYRTVGALKAESLSAHIRHTNLNGLIRLSAYLEDHSVIIGLVLCTNRLSERIQSSIGALVDSSRIIRNADGKARQLIRHTTDRQLQRQATLTAGGIYRVAVRTYYIYRRFLEKLKPFLKKIVLFTFSLNTLLQQGVEVLSLSPRYTT